MANARSRHRLARSIEETKNDNDELKVTERKGASRNETERGAFLPRTESHANLIRVALIVFAAALLQKSKYHPGQWVEVSLPAYRNRLKCFRNTTNVSWWMVQIQPNDCRSWRTRPD